ncbi:hypothetical protein ALC60_09258, partial [Trachymyrmex zeteki]
DAKTTLFIVNSELSQSLDNRYFSSSSVPSERLFLDETSRDGMRRGEAAARQGETERRSAALKGKSFKLRERKKNAFLLIPDKYVGKRAAESAALCLRSNGFVKLCWYAAKREKHVKRRLPGCFGNFELLRFTGPKKQSGVLGAQLFHRRLSPYVKTKTRFCATVDTLESATFFLWRSAANSSVASTAAAARRWSYNRKEGGRRLGGGNRVEGRRTYSLHTAHSLKDNYSFAIDLKISEILASAEPFPVEKYRRRGAGVGEKVPRKGDASGCERQEENQEEDGRSEGGREGCQSEGFAEQRLADCSETFVFLGSPNP